MTQLNVRDWALALQQAGGSEELATDLFDMLLRELPQHHSALATAFTAGDHQALLQTAHKLNGAATYTGVPALKQAVETLEIRVKRGDTVIAPLLNAVLTEINRVLAVGSDNLKHAHGF